MQGVIRVIALVAVSHIAFAAIEDNFPKQKLGPDGYIFEVPSQPLLTPKKFAAEKPKTVVPKAPVVATTTRPVSTYLPPVTCAPGLVAGRSGKCECPGSLKLVNGKCDCEVGYVRKGDQCDKPTPAPTPVPTRATQAPTKPAGLRCSPPQKLVGGACVDPPKPVVVDDGYCPSGLIQKGKECVCPVADQVNVNGKCVCPGSLKLVNLKCECEQGYVRKGDNCEKPAVPVAPVPQRSQLKVTATATVKPFVTTKAPTAAPSTYLPPVTCAPGQVLGRTGKCEAPVTAKVTVAPTKSSVRCSASQKLVGGVCVDVPKPTVKVATTTQKVVVVTEGYCPSGFIQKPDGSCVCPPGTVQKGETCDKPVPATAKPVAPLAPRSQVKVTATATVKPVVTTKAPTPAPSTYLPPVTCAPGFVVDKLGKCGCAAGFTLVNGKCEKPTVAPVTTRAVPVQTRKVVPVAATTTKPPFIIDEGYCPSGLVQKGKECVCPTPGQVRKGNDCVCPGNLQLINFKCDCEQGYVRKGDNCEKPTPVTVKPVVPTARVHTLKPVVSTRVPTAAPSTYLPPVTCAPGQVLGKTGKCEVPTKVTTRATVPPTKPTVRCLPTQKLVGESCVEVPKTTVKATTTTPKPVTVKEGYCPSGFIQKPDGSCVCPLGTVQKGESCDKVVVTTVKPRILTDKPVTTPRSQVTTKVPTAAPSTYLPPVTCAPGQVLGKTGKCEVPTKVTTRATVPPTKPTVRCLPTQKLVGESCVEVPKTTVKATTTTPKPVTVKEGYCPSGFIQKPDGSCVCPPGTVQKGESCDKVVVTTVKPRILTDKPVTTPRSQVTTKVPTAAPSTYLPPVTCAPGQVLGKTGKCEVPTKVTTRTTVPPTKPTVRCSASQKLVGGSCVEVSKPTVKVTTTTPKPVTVKEGYCPSGFIQKPDGSCVCPPGTVQKGESCDKVVVTTVKPRILTDKPVTTPRSQVTTKVPTAAPSTYLPPVTCAPGQVLGKTGKCEVPTKVTTRATVPPTKPTVRCSASQKLVGGSCVEVSKPTVKVTTTTPKPVTVKEGYCPSGFIQKPDGSCVCPPGTVQKGESCDKVVVTTVKPRILTDKPVTTPRNQVTTKVPTAAPSTYLPPVTCAPGQVLGKTGKCEVPTKVTTRATVPPTKPTVRCSASQKLVGGSCVEVSKPTVKVTTTTPKPVTVKEGYCPSGFIQKPDGSCVCPPGTVQKGESCDKVVVTTVKPRILTDKPVTTPRNQVTTKVPTAAPSTYLPPVTCAPGQVLSKTGKCEVPTKVTTRATVPPTKPTVRCSASQKLVGGSCVEVSKPTVKVTTTTPKPVTVKEGYCPSGFIQKPDGSCVCPPGTVQKGESCDKVVVTTVKPRILTDKPVTTPRNQVTTKVPTAAPSTYLPPVTCAPGQVLGKTGKCEVPTKVTTRATVPPTKPTVRCLPTQKLVGGSCVEVTKTTVKVTTKAPTTAPVTYLPPVTCAPGQVLSKTGKCEVPTKVTTRATVPPTKPRILTDKPVTTTVPTAAPSTYLPPVTCAPGQVLGKTGKCEVPTKVTTRATVPPTKPTVRCLPTQKLVGESCVEVPKTTVKVTTTTTPKPVTVKEGYCPSGFIQKPDGSCVCPPGTVQKGETCDKLVLTTVKPVQTPKVLTDKPFVTTKGTTTKPPATYLPPVPRKPDSENKPDFEAPPYLPPSTTTTVRTTPKPKATLPPKPKVPENLKPAVPTTKARPLTPVVDVTVKPVAPIVKPQTPPRPPAPPTAPRPATTKKPNLLPNHYVYDAPSVAF